MTLKKHARPSCSTERAERVRAAREILGTNQAVAAQLIGVHAVTLSRWECGVLAIPHWHLALLEVLADRVRRKDGDSSDIEAGHFDDIAALVVSRGPIFALETLLQRRYPA